MSSQSCILVVGGTYIGSMRSSHKCHRPSSYSVLRRRVSQSWVLSDTMITRNNSNTWIGDSRSSTMSPECLWTTRGLAPAGSAGAKMYESSSLVYLRGLFRCEEVKRGSRTSSNVHESTSWWLESKYAKPGLEASWTCGALSPRAVPHSCQPLNLHQP